MKFLDINCHNAGSVPKWGQLQGCLHHNWKLIIFAVCMGLNHLPDIGLKHVTKIYMNKRSIQNVPIKTNISVFWKFGDFSVHELQLFFFPNHFKHTSHLIVKLIKWPLLNQFCHDSCVMSWPTVLTKRVVVCRLLYLQNFNNSKIKNQLSIRNKITGLRSDTFSCCWPLLSWKMKAALGNYQHHSQYLFVFLSNYMSSYFSIKCNRF